jgi:hypothetical protein
MGKAVFFFLLLDAAVSLPLEIGNDGWGKPVYGAGENIEQHL